LKSASRADVCVVAGVTVAAVLAAAMGASAQSRSGAAESRPAWFVCAEGAPGHVIHPIKRLTALSDKALVEADIARVFAQREKEQRVSAANLAKARVSIDFLYMAGEGTRREYYYEASKTIPDAEGLLRVAVSGWLRGDGAQPRSLGSKGELHWLELAEDPGADTEIIPNPPPIPDPAASLLPQGVLGHAAGHVWVMKRAIGNGALLVYDVGAGGVRLRPKSSARACS
jgi:hypothetical protein